MMLRLLLLLTLSTTAFSHNLTKIRNIVGNLLSTDLSHITVRYEDNLWPAYAGYTCTKKLIIIHPLVKTLSKQAAVALVLHEVGHTFNLSHVSAKNVYDIMAVGEINMQGEIGRAHV